MTLSCLMRSLTALAVLVVAVTSSVAQTHDAAVEADVHIFWSPTCPHCERALAFLERLKVERPSLRLHKHDVDGDGTLLFRRANEAFAIETAAVPMIVIGDRVFVGYGDDESSGAAIRRQIDTCLTRRCPDLVKPLVPTAAGTIPRVERPSVPGTIALPGIGEVETARLSLPLLTIAMAAVDGFNPCAMWGLVFLLGLLIGIEDRRRMWVLGTTFLAVSALVYYAIIAAWLNVLLLLGALTWIRSGIGVVAIAGGIYYLREFARGETSCEVVSTVGRRRLMDHLKDSAQRPGLGVAMFGVAVLAVAVNLVDLLCSAGLPAVYTEVLTQSRLTLAEYHAYLALYIAVFMADDLLVFVIAMTTLALTGIGQRFVRASTLLGGLILTSIGTLLLVRPEWLSFR